MASQSVAVYGAYGYTGRLIVDALLRNGVRPVLGGRDARRLDALARQTGLETRPCAVKDLAEALVGLDALVLAAGPFGATAAPAVEACLRTRTHYLDVSGDYRSIDLVRTFHPRAHARGVMLLPAVGFDVVASDCLMAYVAGRLPGATELSLGVSGLELLSRGSAYTIIELLGQPVAVRRHGVLTHVPIGSLNRFFDFGRGPRSSVATSWGDVVTAYHTTGVPNTSVFFEATMAVRLTTELTRIAPTYLQNPVAQRWMRAYASTLSSGPSTHQRVSRSACLVAEARHATGVVRARLQTPEAYSFTALSAAAIVRRVLRGDTEVGFQTPARLYGPEFVLAIDGVTRTELGELSNPTVGINGGNHHYG